MHVQVKAYRSMGVGGEDGTGGQQMMIVLRPFEGAMFRNLAALVDFVKVAELSVSTATCPTTMEEWDRDVYVDDR